MPPNKQLIENFDADRETKDLAIALLRVAKTATAEGSGRALGPLAPGLEAVCMLLASERLNSGDVTDTTAQRASCLSKNDFRKARETIRAAIEAHEKSTLIKYDALYRKYEVTHLEDAANEYILNTENNLMLNGNQESETTLFRCVVFFWVLAAAKIKTLPSTEEFAAAHSLPLKTFVRLLDVLNLHAKDTKRKLAMELKAKVSSPAKQLVTRSTGNAGSGAGITSAPEDEGLHASPTRRSGRLNDLTDMVVSTPFRQSPWKQQPIPSPVKVAQPQRFAYNLGKRLGPLRELPSKNSPKKRAADDSRPGNSMSDDVLTTPTKKTKLDSSPSQPVTSPSRTTSISPAKKQIPPATSIFPTRPAPLPALVPTNDEVADVEPNPILDASADSEDGYDEELEPVGRFRPVYLEHKQWCALDPRLARVRRKEKDASKSAYS